MILPAVFTLVSVYSGDCSTTFFFQTMYLWLFRSVVVVFFGTTGIYISRSNPTAIHAGVLTRGAGHSERDEPGKTILTKGEFHDGQA